MASITLEGVTKQFPDGTVAVDDLTLHVEDGEFLVLVGPSGCGKSTALRMIAGLEELTKGEIRIADHVVTDLPPRDRDIAMVFQNYALYPHMTVFDNMAFGLKLRKVPKPEIRRRVEAAADLLAIRELLGRKPRALSGGQRQRVAMGRAIVREPAAFLMDEPLSNLDAKLRVQMRSEIAKLHQRLGTTTVYVTHDQTEAITMADRVAVLRSGVLQQAGPPQALYEEPVNLFVAGFIGSPAMNLVPARLATDNSRAQVTFGKHRIAVPDDVVERRAGQLDGAGREVILGIRPEDMEDASLVRETGTGRLLDVTVGLAEPMGAETIVHFDVDAPPVRTKDVLDLAADVDQGADPAAAASLLSSGLWGLSHSRESAGTETTTFTARLNPRTTARAGTSVQIAVDVERIYLFDPATGKALR